MSSFATLTADGAVWTGDVAIGPVKSIACAHRNRPVVSNVSRPGLHLNIEGSLWDVVSGGLFHVIQCPRYCGVQATSDLRSWARSWLDCVPTVFGIDVTFTDSIEYTSSA